MLLCSFEQVFGSGWEVDVEPFHSPLRVLRSFLTSRMSAALVFLFAGYFFQASQAGFSRFGIEIVTWFVMFSPRYMSWRTLFLKVCKTIWQRDFCLCYEQFYLIRRVFGLFFGNEDCMLLNQVVFPVTQMYVCT